MASFFNMNIDKHFQKMEAKINRQFGEDFTYFPISNNGDVNHTNSSTKKDPDRSKLKIQCPFEERYDAFKINKNKGSFGQRPDSFNSLTQAQPHIFISADQLSYTPQKADMIYRHKDKSTYFVIEVTKDQLGRYSILLDKKS